MGNPIAWFDLTSKNAGVSRSFYSEVFGWKIDVDPQMGYGMVDTGSAEGIPGGIGENPDAAPALVVYLVVDNAEETLKQVEANGGQRDVPPYEIPGIGTMATFKDPDGITVGLWQR
ncbi:VOC family protein [Herbidospora yilanensis]|uniref:VOC family protein n=1 Tax=Herbidospora yilanensis TaxID=354426 RepID=UPI000784DE69|nr:VOC family protein [Herbidospora yilanensis]